MSFAPETAASAPATPIAPLTAAFGVKPFGATSIGAVGVVGSTTGAAVSFGVTFGGSFVAAGGFVTFGSGGGPFALAWSGAVAGAFAVSCLTLDAAFAASCLALDAVFA